jgi:dienelactone hydrolase
MLILRWALPLLVLISLPLLAQERASAPRADGAVTPMLVYRPYVPGCAPLAIISHGAGGNENGYSYLAQNLADQGWLAIVVGHKESGPDVLRHDIFRHGLRGGLLALTTNATAYRDRFMDIGAALQWASTRCRVPYRVLLGHSMGAATVMLEAGARNKLGLKGEDRFDAYVALSPQGPGSIFPENAWNGIHKPLLILTGTRDRAVEGGWKSRTVPFDSLPPGCHWLGVIDGATHMNFAGAGMAGKTESLALPVIDSFLRGARSGHCALPPEKPGIQLRSKE